MYSGVFLFDSLKCSYFKMWIKEEQKFMEVIFP